MRLETLEDRTVLSTVTYGPGFSGGIQAAINQAGPSGTVIVEPGSAAGSATVSSNMTIEGASNSNPSQLPQLNLTLNANHVSLLFLNLGNVTISQNFGFETINNSNVVSISEQSGATTNGNNIIAYDQITGSVNLIGNGTTGNVTSDFLEFNTFGTANTPDKALYLLNVEEELGIEVQFNTFYGSGDGQIAVRMVDVDNLNTALGVSNNTIVLHGTSTNTIGISFANPASIFMGGDGLNQGPARSNGNIAVFSNNIKTDSGIGVAIEADSADPFVGINVQSNDFHNNAIGIRYTSTVGGLNVAAPLNGQPSSDFDGGNNFRSFTAQATANSGAVVLLGNTPTGGFVPITLNAEGNIFNSSVVPSSVVFSAVPVDKIDVTNPESLTSAFSDNVARILGISSTSIHVGSSGNLHSAVLSGLFAGGYSNIVNNLYIEFLGRQADPNGLSSWVSMLEKGSSLQTVEAGILSSSEYTNRHGGSGDALINNYFETLLGRAASNTDLLIGQFVELFFGDQAVASMVLNSTEYETKIVTQDFQTILHRDPTSQDLAVFTAPHTDLLSTEVTLLSTNEFFYNG